MPENALSLLELNQTIKSVIKENTARGYWVIGEISELKVNISGHCYLELIQKDEHSEQILARSRATIWAQNFRLIRPYFETTTGQMLTEGISIMVKVNVEFHELFGLSLNIRDIEPTYTVGEMALRKQKIIDRLVEEGVIDMNKGLELPLPCQKIAIISSPTAAGYEDFLKQIRGNPYGYTFYLKLFPSIMQGEEAESSMIAALDAIYQYESFFDAVVIIRGGGSQTDLNCFNSYWLAYHITQFPLPVLTGIGHEQDDSVVDRVANTRLKTPTAVATFLIEMMAHHENELEEVYQEILERVQEGVRDHSNRLVQTLSQLHHGVRDKLVRHGNRLNGAGMRLHKNSGNKLGLLRRNLDKRVARLTMNARLAPVEQVRSLKTYSQLLRQAAGHKRRQTMQHLALLEERLHALDPVRIMDRGYSITLKEGKVVKDSKSLKKDDTIITLLKKGSVESIIKKSEK